ncbi:PEP-CTERM sorting domain-containing protein [Leptothoe kymatousa]|uniref:PEP-CTERM sorting domain-containing protein n=1 Tax=Leptothoe kymatousa TAU-MAC 1615 TaxID=2364775 RepID=A0ABS5Y543_9CYAN|nr:PEP-CTERM sorting domain-containing protein [Leptothoe kymatousa]MBT9312947.1 PEP-CTERM sorting domain-containing protein [Leptothoe kymatousa TAU-MAC 1615]
MNIKTIVAGVVGAAVVGVGIADSAQAAGLVNYNFEDATGAFPGLNQFRFVNKADVSGWQTTDNNVIEIWGDGFHGVAAGEGNYFAELNAHKADTLFQEVSNIEAGQKMGFSFMHRARSGTDVMNLEITDLGLDNVFGTADDTVLFTKDYSATTAQWELNTSENEAAITTLGNNMRFAYSAVSTGSGNNSVGNFLDAAQFGLASEVTPGAESQDVPEPASILALLAVGGVAAGGALRKKQAA